MTELNIHPAFVHFPIAFLTLYTACEVCRISALTRQQWYTPVKAVLLFAGVITGALFTIPTGKLAEGAFEGTSTAQLVELHEQFAFSSIILYALLATLYILQMRSPTFMAAYRTPVLVIGSILGFLFLTTTGALGGAIVYGPDIDPAVSFIYHLFFK